MPDDRVPGRSVHAAGYCSVAQHTNGGLAHFAKPLSVASCWARMARRITSKVCCWGQALSVRLMTSETRSG